jgi:4,5-dihydroxyphthalate decarboxylase
MAAQEKIKVHYGGELYDRNFGLIDGSVKLQGIDFRYEAGDVREIFARMTLHKEFDCSEFGLIRHIMFLSNQDEPSFVGIPVFTVKAFRHRQIFVNANSGVEKPEDLAGKKVGIPAFANDSGVWVRGLLRHEYGVDTRSIIWVKGPVISPDEKWEYFKAAEPPQTKFMSAPPGLTLVNMLERGEIDALIPHRPPASFFSKGTIVRRLFPDYKEAELKYYKKTKIFPICHTVVLKREVYDKNPWVAESLFNAFEESKEKFYERRNRDPSFYSLSWPSNLEEETAIFGAKDPWTYGVDANKKTLEAFIEYLDEEGLVRRKPTLKEVYPA